MSRAMSQGGVWFALKAAFLLTLFAILIVALLLIIQGEEITRRAAVGLAVVPPVIVFYILRFKKVEFSARSIVAHLGAVLCAAVLGFCILLHKSDPSQFKGVGFTLLLVAITIALFGYGILLICVLTFSGYGQQAKVRFPHSEHAQRETKTKSQQVDACQPATRSELKPSQDDEP